MRIINRYGCNLSPCKTPAIMSKKSVSPSVERTFDFRVSIEHYYGRSSFFGGDHKLEVFAPSFLCIRNQMTWKNLQTVVLSRDVLQEFLRWFDGFQESVKIGDTETQKKTSYFFNLMNLNTWGGSSIRGTFWEKQIKISFRIFFNKCK